MAYQAKTCGIYLCDYFFLVLPPIRRSRWALFGQGFIKALLGEIREEHRGKIELRIGALPQQEVGDAFPRAWCGS